MTKDVIIYEAVMGSDGIQTEMLEGVKALGVVYQPAIESTFVALSQDAKADIIEAMPVVCASKEQRRLVGALMIPDKLTYDGEDNQGRTAYTKWSAETIMQAQERFAAYSSTHNVTHEHVGGKADGLVIVESWIVQDAKNDKAAALGIDVPAGTWMVAVKVNSDAYWNDYVKTGKVRGFSLEGWFGRKPVQASAPEKPKKKRRLSQIINKSVRSALSAIFQTQTPIDMKVNLLIDGTLTPLELDENDAVEVADDSGEVIGTLQFMPAVSEEVEAEKKEDEDDEEYEKSVTKSAPPAPESNEDASKIASLEATVTTLQATLKSLTSQLPKHKEGDTDPSHKAGFDPKAVELAMANRVMKK